MPWALERTSWRGVRVDHPGEWEIAIASGPDDPGRVTFADRYYHRLDVRWQKVRRPPNLELMLEKHRQNPQGQLRDLSLLAGLPEGWHGLLRRGDDGCVTYAAKVFGDQRLLVETTLVWPQQRDTALEGAILNSVAVASISPPRLWQAMGISLDLPEAFELRSFDSSVGRVRWNFSNTGKAATTLTVERLAMPEYWLKSSLEDWLVEQLPKQQTAVQRQTLDTNGHVAYCLLSRGKARLLKALRSLKPLRLDQAWLCPAEGRLYHVSVSRTSKTENLDLPPGLVLRCCRPVPQVGRIATGRA